MANSGGMPDVSKVTESAGASFQPDQAVVGLQRSSCAKQSALVGLAIGAAGTGHRYLSTRTLGRSLHSGLLLACAGAAVAFATCRYPEWNKQRQVREHADFQLATREQLERQFDDFAEDSPSGREERPE